jgi:hypothetical protein
MIDMTDARDMARALAYDLAKDTYKLREQASVHAEPAA